MRWVPHPYQIEAMKFMVSHGSAGLFLDPGLGKTSIVYGAFKILRKAGLVRNMLVVAPLRPAHSVWPGEAAKWDDFQDLKVVVLHGKNKEELLCSDADVFVINYEGLDWLFKSMLRAPGWWDMLVIDESTRLKHPGTMRFKLLKHYLPKFKRRYILTGTPAPNGYMDLFGQIYVLDLGAALGKYITHFKNNYFAQPYPGSFNWFPRPGAGEAIQKLVAPLVLRMSGRDYLHLPPLINNTVEIELPKEAMLKYLQMEVALLMELENSEVILAANSGVASTKCRQIANGGIYHDGGERWTNIHEAKVDAVEDLIEELSGKPALVAYEYKHDLERLRKRFGPDTPYIGGGVSAAKFKEIEVSWNAGRIPILLAQPQSVAHGLNLQGTGAAVIWHSLTWDREAYDQLVARVWRQGQQERVVVHHIVAKGTVDEVIVAALGRKDRTQQGLLEALKAHLRRAA